MQVKTNRRLRNSTMERDKYTVYGYRWIILVVFMLVILANQLLWITFAPITIDAARFYGVSDFKIGILSMSFMLVYIVISIPASWMIDQYGIKIAVGIGAIFTGVFGILRGFLADQYGWVLAAQIGIAIGQPFILNAITKLAARWFPIQERATASGLATLAMYVGILLGMIVTPALTSSFGFQSMLWIYGYVSLITMALFFLFIRERPVTPPCESGQEERALIFDGFKHMLRQRGFIFLLGIFFIGLGVFNAIATWIEDIVRPRGFTPGQAGLTGGLLILAGVVGAIVLPPLSDHYRKRIPFILVALGGSLLGLIGITFATSYWMLLTSASVLGFFLLSAGPIGFQYGAELTYPAPEGTSNGLLLLMGQISGILFIVAMNAFKAPTSGSMTMPLVGLIILMIISLGLGTQLQESSFLSPHSPD
jgi:MFS family permease